MAVRTILVRELGPVRRRARASAFELEGPQVVGGAVGTADPTQLPLAIGQNKDSTAYDALNVPGMSAGDSYNDPVTNVKIYKVADSTTPVANSKMIHHYSAGGPFISLPWTHPSTGRVNYTLWIAKWPGASSYLVDFDYEQRTFSNWRTAPWGELQFGFSCNPSTPRIGYYCNGSVINRYDTASDSVDNTGNYPATGFGADRAYEHDKNDRFHTGRTAGGVVYTFDSQTGLTKNWGGSYDGAHVDLGGVYHWPPGQNLGRNDIRQALLPDGAWQGWFQGWDPDWRMSHEASMDGTIVAANQNTNGLHYWDTATQQLVLIGPGNTSSGGGHRSGQWVVNNDSGTDKWFLDSTFKNGGAIRNRYGVSFVRLSDEWRFLCHHYSYISNEYYEQPHATMSPDGKIVLFASCMNVGGSSRVDCFLAIVPTTQAAVAVSADDAHYFTGLDGHPLFFLGFYDAYGWWGNATKRASLRTAFESNDLNLAWIAPNISGSGASSDFFPYDRPGPGTAYDGYPKYDITSHSTAFFDELDSILSWAEANGIYVMISLLNGIAFKSRGDTWAWEGCCYRPSNRINTEADEVGARGSNPDMYDIFNPGGGWTSEADRTWLRDRVKALVDKVLQTGAPYKSWFIEIGNENTSNQAYKEYWSHYIKGTSHAIDDGAVSPYADSAYLVVDNSDFGYDMGSSAYVEGQVVHNVTVGNVAAKTDAMYADGEASINNSDGSETNDRTSNRRAAWIALTHGGHWFSFTSYNPPTGLAYLADFERTMGFLRADRVYHTIERVLPNMKPNQAIVSNGHALDNDSGQTERYLVFATAGNNPTLTVVSAGLTIKRFDTITGSETTEGTTTAGSNNLTGTGNDTAWWIE